MIGGWIRPRARMIARAFFTWARSFLEASAGMSAGSSTKPTPRRQSWPQLKQIRWSPTLGLSPSFTPGSSVARSLPTPQVGQAWRGTSWVRIEIALGQTVERLPVRRPRHADRLDAPLDIAPARRLDVGHARGVAAKHADQRAVLRRRGDQLPVGVGLSRRLDNDEIGRASWRE